MRSRLRDCFIIFLLLQSLRHAQGVPPPFTQGRLWVTFAKNQASACHPERNEVKSKFAQVSETNEANRGATRRRDLEAGLAIFFENKSNIMLGKDNEISL